MNPYPNRPQTSLANFAFSFLAAAAALIMPARATGPAKEVNAGLLPQAQLRIKAIYETDDFRVRSFEANWLPDGSGYLKLETPDGESGPEIARYDSASGHRSVVVDREKLLVPGTAERLSIHGFVCSLTGKRFLLHTEEAGGSDRWLYELESGDLRPVKAGDGVGFEANAFSPDGERLLGSRGVDLLVYDIAHGRATSLTQDTDSDAINNGSASWSPDGQWIAYIQSDSSAVPKRAVLVPGDPTYRTFQETRFERIGGHDPDHYLRTDGDVRPETIPHRLNAATSFQM